tara:strand:+ start:455 stop:1729 length:1275 start_codon:yes stop_codon:yes gene_type:complete
MATGFDWMQFDRGEDSLRNPLWQPYDARYGSAPVTASGGGFQPDTMGTAPPFSMFNYDYMGENQRIDPATVKPGQWGPITAARSLGDPNMGAMYRMDMLSQLLGDHKPGDVILSDQERRMMQQDWGRQVNGNLASRNDAITPYREASQAAQTQFDTLRGNAMNAFRDTATQYDPRMAGSVRNWDSYRSTGAINELDGNYNITNPIDRMFMAATPVDTGNAGQMDAFYASTDLSNPLQYQGWATAPDPSSYLNHLRSANPNADFSQAQTALTDWQNYASSVGARTDGGQNRWFPQSQMTATQAPDMSGGFAEANQRQQQAGIINQQAYDQMINKGQDGATIPKDASRPFYGQITGVQGWGSQGDGWNPNAAWGMPNSSGMTYNSGGPGNGIGWGSTGFGQQQQRASGPNAQWGGVFANQNPWALS